MWYCRPLVLKDMKTRGFVKLLGPISRVSGPGKACGCAFLASSQVTPMLLVQGHALRATGIGKSGGSADLS